MKTISIEEVLQTCIEYLQDPAQPAAEKKLSDLKAQLIVRDYMPLEQKEIIIAKIIADMREAQQARHFAAVALELSLVFNGLLAYSNINPSIEGDLKATELYDVLQLSGIIDYILGFCQKDYEKLEKIVYQMISFDNMKSLMTLMNDIDTESVEDLTKEFKRFTLDTTTERLSLWAKLVDSENPTYSTLKEQVEDAAFKKVMAKKAVVAEAEVESEEDEKEALMLENNGEN